MSVASDFIYFGVFSLYDYYQELQAKIKLNKDKKKQDRHVRVITWWGYLSYPKKIAELERRCGAKISVVEYTQASDFLRLIQRNPYDIYIYPVGCTD